jgi:glutathione S-transferase
VRAALNDEVLPRHLACLETILSRSQTGWIANTEGPSVADFILVPRLRWLESGDNAGISTEILEPFPLLRALMLKLLALPGVVAFYNKA